MHVLNRLKRRSEVVNFGSIATRRAFLATALEMTQDAVNVAQLPEFDEIVDVRSPSEFSLDHIPGAINCPVLYDDELARVGTL